LNQDRARPHLRLSHAGPSRMSRPRGRARG
jgi:hypothetical protein